MLSDAASPIVCRLSPVLLTPVLSPILLLSSSILTSGGHRSSPVGKSEEARRRQRGVHRAAVELPQRKNGAGRRARSLFGEPAAAPKVNVGRATDRLEL